MHDHDSAPIQLYGRSSSHFTRLALLFARELGVACELVPIHDMTQVDPAIYAGNPALKMPTLRRGGSLVFGAENICRTLADLAAAPPRIVWPEALRSDLARNAQELVWHGMAAEVQLIFGTMVAQLPADNVYFAKARQGFAGALRWLDDHLERALAELPAPRDLSLFEASLLCLVEHVAFRGTLSLDPYPALARFAATYGARPAAQQTRYRFDPPPT